MRYGTVKASVVPSIAAPIAVASVERGRTTDKSEISANSSEMIDRLVGMSEKYGFSLEFTVIPFDRTPEEQMAINACIDYATDKGIRCTDFTALRDQIDLIGVSDYIDDCHLNALGAGKQKEGKESPNLPF